MNDEKIREAIERGKKSIAECAHPGCRVCKDTQLFIDLAERYLDCKGWPEKTTIIACDIADEHDCRLEAKVKNETIDMGGAKTTQLLQLKVN